MAGAQPVTVDTTFADKVRIVGFIEQHVHPVLAAITMRSVVILIEPWDSRNGFSDQVRDEAGYQALLLGLYIGRRDQTNIMAEGRDFASPIVQRPTGFHPDLARLEPKQNIKNGARRSSFCKTTAPSAPTL